jgi:toxin HigB-1
LIISFEDKETEDVFHGIHTHRVRKTFPSDFVKVCQRKMDILNCADTLENIVLLFPGVPEALERDAHDTYSVPIAGDYRLAFRWDKGNLTNLKIK